MFGETEEEKECQGKNWVDPLGEPDVEDCPKSERSPFLRCSRGNGREITVYGFPSWPETGVSAEYQVHDKYDNCQRQCYNDIKNPEHEKLDKSIAVNRRVTR